VALAAPVPAAKRQPRRRPFFVGSLAKSFTALAVMQLVEAGKIELDAPVQRYLPWFRVADPQASAEMTVRHLLNQTSGLPESCGETALANFDDHPGATERRPSGGCIGWKHLLLPLVPNLMIALTLRSVLGKRRGYLRLFMPDYSWIAMVCGSFSLLWSVLRTGLVLRTLRRRQGCKYSKLFLEDATA
jgi:CubicO group peptidase (beta-lactamase class C family)